MKRRFAHTADLTDTGADQSFTPGVVAPLNTTDFHTSNDEGHLHQAELGNLVAMARSIFHQVGATEATHPELTTLVNFDSVNGANPRGNLIADAHGDLFGTTELGGALFGTIANTPGGAGPGTGDGTVFEIAKTANNLALARPAHMRTPDKIMSSLLFARLLESEHKRSLRVHSAEYVPNDPVLAGGIEGLQHNKKGLAAVRVKQVLQLVQALDVFLDLG